MNPIQFTVWAVNIGYSYWSSDGHHRHHGAPGASPRWHVVSACTAPPPRHWEPGARRVPGSPASLGTTCPGEGVLALHRAFGAHRGRHCGGVEGA